MSGAAGAAGRAVGAPQATASDHHAPTSLPLPLPIAPPRPAAPSTRACRAEMMDNQPATPSKNKPGRRPCSLTTLLVLFAMVAGEWAPQGRHAAPGPPQLRWTPAAAGGATPTLPPAASRRPRPGPCARSCGFRAAAQPAACHGNRAAAAARRRPRPRASDAAPISRRARVTDRARAPSPHPPPRPQQASRSLARSWAAAAAPRRTTARPWWRACTLAATASRR